MEKSKKEAEYQHSIERARKGEMLPVCVCVRLRRICNLACDYCSEIRDLGPDMDFSKWKEAVQRIYNLGNRDLTFSGGEPVVVNFLTELIRVASSKGMYVSLASNGTLLTSDKLEELNKAGLDFLSLSIDRVVADDKSFGKDLTPALAGTLDYIASRRFNFETVVSTVITERNFRQLENMVEYFTDRKIYHKFMLMMPNYHSPTKTENLGISDIAGFETVIANIKGLKRKGFMVLDGDQILSNMIDYLKGKFTFNCKGGIYELSINNDGRLVLCPDGTLTSTTIFQLRSLADYATFIKQHTSRAYECSGCFWTCKQRLHDKILHDTNYLT